RRCPAASSWRNNALEQVLRSDGSAQSPILSLVFLHVIIVRPPPRHGLTEFYEITGRFLPKAVACSNACAICRTLKSSLSRPTICTPTGRPSGVNPPGTDAAGFPVDEI